eukprot:CAMPEP_0184288286 /NCGR_PEP_ID=MMETSP1049-20130417/799_1 /TAXON_ID=77928 /ORGANISM="Proteomonas sulcata, Strain CCMP704" /LENGTH=52 /DNA_ID=CAMNT_0026594591 /DNA_START=123 /DNA_END=278 /DNA_ORIENTATION=-
MTIVLPWPISAPGGTQSCQTSSLDLEQSENGALMLGIRPLVRALVFASSRSA